MSNFVNIQLLPNKNVNFKHCWATSGDEDEYYTSCSQGGV